MIINDKLNWQEHVDKLHKKASSRLYFVSKLKRTKMSSSDIVKVYVSLVRPVLEYACQLWHAGLTDHQRDMLESIQQRALKIAFLSQDYDDALVSAKLQSLFQRRQELCRRLFNSAQDPSHKRHPLLPHPRKITHNQRNPSKYPLPKSNTNR